MNFSKEINDVVRKSINHRNLSSNYEDSVAYSESLCNELADKISKLVEGQKPATNTQIMPACPMCHINTWVVSVGSGYRCNFCHEHWPVKPA